MLVINKLIKKKKVFHLTLPIVANKMWNLNTCFVYFDPTHQNEMQGDDIHRCSDELRSAWPSWNNLVNNYGLVSHQAHFKYIPSPSLIGWALYLDLFIVFIFHALMMVSNEFIYEKMSYLTMPHKNVLYFTLP